MKILKRRRLRAFFCCILEEKQRKGLLMMKAICPKNEEHKQFITVAHVMQDWLVDEQGNWLETVDESLETSFPPNKDNLWTCAVCGAEAILHDK